MAGWKIPELNGGLFFGKSQQAIFDLQRGIPSSNSTVGPGKSKEFLVKSHLPSPTHGKVYVNWPEGNIAIIAYIGYIATL